MKILVTGGAGFIGSHVVDRFVDAGFEVVVVDNLSTGSLEKLNPAARFYRIDLRDSDLVTEVFERERPNIVSHHAAEADIAITNETPASAVQSNIIGTINVLQNSVRFGIEKLIFISTAAAYGEPTFLPLTTAHPLNPTTPYGITKAAGEYFVRFFGETYGLNWTVLRYANAYGPRQNPRGEAGVVSIFARRLLLGETCMITWDGEQRKDYVYVSDLADVNMLVVCGANQKTYNIGTGIPTSVNQIYAQLAVQSGSHMQPVYAPKRPGDIPLIYFDTTETAQELGWRSRVSFEEGMGHVVEYYRSRPVDQP